MGVFVLQRHPPRVLFADPGNDRMKWTSPDRRNGGVLAGEGGAKGEVKCLDRCRRVGRVVADTITEAPDHRDKEFL